MFLLVNGGSLGNKKATVKSLTSTNLTNFVEASNNLESANREVSSNQTTIEKCSIINLNPSLFSTDEIVDEAPLFFVGKTTNVNPTQNLQQIIESYRIFKEISSIEDKDVEDELR